MESTLSEHYPIYNWPVLSKLAKLPKKITRKVKVGNDDEYIDKIEEHVFEISNARLNKMTTSIIIPGYPQYSNTISAVFMY
jgi:hypothetical protein